MAYNVVTTIFNRQPHHHHQQHQRQKEHAVWQEEQEEAEDSSFKWFINKADADYNEVEGEGQVLILHWTKWHGMEVKPRNLTEQDCHQYFVWMRSTFKSPTKSFFSKCRITSDKNYAAVSDALVFHSRDLYLGDKLPKERDWDQVWVYWQQESPQYTYLDLHPFSNVFNWTMSYRDDSDVFHPYGHIIPVVENPKLKQFPISRNKTGLVAWIVSHCGTVSKRDQLVAELKKHIPVDVFGRCGKPCAERDCYDHVSKHYKFYLSFENSLCSGYITEKFYKAMGAAGEVVPIVYGGRSGRDYSAVAPKGSYIDVRDFKSAEDLAVLLHHLDKHEDEYLKYFRWKSQYKVRVPGMVQSLSKGVRA